MSDHLHNVKVCRKHEVEFCGNRPCDICTQIDALKIALGHLEDSMPYLAMEVMRKTLGLQAVTYNCQRCQKPIGEHQIKGKTYDGYICCACVSFDILSDWPERKNNG